MITLKKVETEIRNKFYLKYLWSAVPLRYLISETSWLNFLDKEEFIELLRNNSGIIKHEKIFNSK